VRILRKGQEVARHVVSQGMGQRQVNLEHLKGVVGARVFKDCPFTVDSELSQEPKPTLLRPLLEYQEVAGGTW
jgi:hypothetical protein